MNATHDPQRQSWVLSANRRGNAFPVQNLPFGVFAGALGPTVGVAIGDQVLDLRGCSGFLGPLPAGTVEVCAASTLNPLIDELLVRQVQDGSWGDNTVNSEYGTAMACIVLQMPNNYLPIFQR